LPQATKSGRINNENSIGFTMGTPPFLKRFVGASDNSLSNRTLARLQKAQKEAEELIFN
jgi:hypothetical protein